MKLDFSNLAQLRVRNFSDLKETEKAILLLWREVNGYEEIAINAATEYSTMKMRIEMLE